MPAALADCRDDFDFELLELAAQHAKRARERGWLRGAARRYVALVQWRDANPAAAEALDLACREARGVPGDLHHDRSDASFGVLHHVVGRMHAGVPGSRGPVMRRRSGGRRRPPP